MAANAVYPLNVSFDDKEIARANGARWNASEKKWEFREIKDMTEDKIVESYVSIKETLKEKGRDVSKLDATGQIEAMIAQRAEKEAAEAAAKAAKEAEEKTKAEAAKQANEEIILDDAHEQQKIKTIETEPELISVVGDKLNINRDILDNIKNKVSKTSENINSQQRNNVFNFAKLLVENARTMVELAQNIGEYTVNDIRGIPEVNSLLVEKAPAYGANVYRIALYSEKYPEKGSIKTNSFDEFDGGELSEYEAKVLEKSPAAIFGFTSIEEGKKISPIFKAICENGVKKHSFLTSYSAGVTNVINNLREVYEKSEQAKAETLSEEAEEEAFKG